MVKLLHVFLVEEVDFSEYPGISRSQGSIYVEVEAVSLPKGVLGHASMSSSSRWLVKREDAKGLAFSSDDCERLEGYLSDVVSKRSEANAARRCGDHERYCRQVFDSLTCLVHDSEERVHLLRARFPGLYRSYLEAEVFLMKAGSVEGLFPERGARTYVAHEHRLRRLMGRMRRLYNGLRVALSEPELSGPIFRPPRLSP